MMLPQRSCSLIRRGALLDMPSTTRCTKIPKSPQYNKLITLQHRHKRSTSITKEARQAISNNKTNNNSTTSATAEAVGDNIFGMRPIDYSILPPIRASPPPPPSKPGLQKYIAPASMVIMFATVGYFYVNNKNDNFEYWAAMQSGEALQMEEDEEDYEDEEEDEDEEK
mmetsp:Transcript_21015/g.32933  ORF Transcript_21015/g.32933 Transcript_21015/m.32933 type:complete len:168 (-) Transcript_21015:277-780(-)